tara:strand:+ start:1639 stop:2418 length:780 start_codon:yes stop_codon:yes gene_type:complete
MAETLTYEEAPQEEFTADELDSLKVGEEIEVEQDNLLAGKYKDAEELEKAYLELQTKLGEKPSEDKVEESEPEEQPKEEESKEEDPEEGPNILDKLWDQKDAGFNEDTLKELAKTNPGDLAKMYLLYRNQVDEGQVSGGLSDSEVTELQGIAGGKDSYGNMMSWAKENLSAKEIEMYDNVMDRGDPNAAYFAVQALNSKYVDGVGKDAQLITGKAPRIAGDKFNSQAELIKAMEDDRYSDDPAYRQAILEKLDRSDVNF